MQQLKMKNEAPPKTPLKYQALGVPRTCLLEEIEKQYKKLVIQLTSDGSKNRTNAHMALERLNAAYDTLKNPKKRAAYDAEQRVPKLAPASKYTERFGPDFAQAASGEATTEAPGKCKICSDDITTLSTIYPCQHEIDLGCIMLWLKEKYHIYGELEQLSCPYCRDSIDTIRHTYQPDGSYSTIDIARSFRSADQARKAFELAACNAGHCPCYFFWEQQEPDLAEYYPVWEQRLPFFAEMQRDIELIRLTRLQPTQNPSYEERQQTWELEQRVQKYEQYLSESQEQRSKEEKQRYRVKRLKFGCASLEVLLAENGQWEISGQGNLDERCKSGIFDRAQRRGKVRWEGNQPFFDDGENAYPISQNFVRHLEIHHAPPGDEGLQSLRPLNSNSGENNDPIPSGQNAGSSSQEEEGRQLAQPQQEEKEFVGPDTQPPLVPCYFCGEIFSICTCKWQGNTWKNMREAWKQPAEKLKCPQGHNDCWWWSWGYQLYKNKGEDGWNFL